MPASTDLDLEFLIETTTQVEQQGFRILWFINEAVSSIVRSMSS
jgi:hypothetical protein